MSDCSQHKKELFGETDMEKIADAIGDLHYECIPLLLYHLSKKIHADAEIDYKGDRKKLASALQYLGMALFESSLRAQIVLKISKPFMK